MKPVGEQDYQVIVANGDNVKLTLNGMIILDSNIRKVTKNETPVKFKDIKIKELIM